VKIRAIGTGSKFCRHPLVPASWLIISGEDLTLVGAPWSVVPTLERYGYAIEKLAVITLLSPHVDQIAGLLELAGIFRHAKKKPILAAPGQLLSLVRTKLEGELGFYLDDAFDVKTIARLHIKEEYYSESISFVSNFLDPRIPSYGMRFENAKVFISGETQLNEDWLFKEMGCEAILHSCTTTKASLGKSPALEELKDLPTYLQSKMWLYGYEVDTKDAEQPFPMMFLPPGSWIFDSERRDKLLSKERFIRENSRKQV